MKKYFFSFLLITITLQVFSQDIQMSEAFLMRTDSHYELIGKVKDKILLLKKETNEFIIQSFDNNLKSTKEEKLELGKNYLKLIGINATSKDFTILFSHKIKGNTHIKAHKYNSNFELLDSTTIKIIDRRAFSPIFQMSKSQNKRYSLLYNVEKDKIVETLVFDVMNMKLVWEYNFQPKGFSHHRDFIDFLVGNDGSAHLIVERDNDRMKKETNRFEFYSYLPQTQNVQNYLLPMKKYLWFDVYFDYDNLNQKIVAGGLYANDSQTKTIGFFYLNINPKDASDKVLKYQAFEKSFVQNVLGKKKPKNDGFSEVDIREIVLRKDGGILLIAERNRQYVRQVRNTSAAYSTDNLSSQIDYYYSDLLVFSIHPTGDLHWEDILYKKQYSQDDDALYSSYFLLKTRNNLRFLYNDDIKQENSVNEYIITGKGESDRKNVMHTQGTQLMLVMKNAIQISIDEVIIPSEYRRQLKLIKLTY